MSPPTVEERIAVCLFHLKGALAWNGPIHGLREMRGRYAHYLKGIPGIRDHCRELVRLSEAEAVAALLRKIGEDYHGYAITAEPIKLVDYHANCSL
jgi:tRNA-dihydrouridine synthase